MLSTTAVRLSTIADMKPSAELVEKWLRDRDLTWADLARLIHESDQTMTNWKTRGLPIAKIAVVSSTLGRDPEELFAATATDRALRNPNYPRAPSVRPKPSGLNALDFKPGNLSAVPIVGRVQAGADGYWTDSQLPVGGGDGVVEVPTNDPNAYALRVVGNSMMPALRPGWMIVVEPNHGPQPGEFVVARLKDGRKMVKEFLYHRAGMWSFISINTEHERLDLMDEEVESVHPVSHIVPPSKVAPLFG